MIAVSQTALTLYHYSPGDSPANQVAADRGFSIFASFSPNTATPIDGGKEGTADCLAAIGLVHPMPGGGEVAVDFVQNCGTDFVNGSGVILPPPRQPFGKNFNRRCIWRVQAQEAQRLRITVEMTEEVSYWDRLFIVRSDDCSPLAPNAEVLEGATYVLEGKAFAVYFYTEENIVPREFRILWHVL